MPAINHDIEAYIAGLLPQRHKVLIDMENQATAHNFPIVGPLVGSLLMQYTKLLQARRVFELGSGFGYSAFWFALGFPGAGQLFCTDLSENNVAQIKRQVGGTFPWLRLHVMAGDALEMLDQTAGEFDIIFMDIDKQHYPRGFQRAWPRVRRGGMLITDNTLWKGKVLEVEPDETTRAVQEYNALAFSQSNALTHLIPFRDGVTVSLKL